MHLINKLFAKSAVTGLYSKIETSAATKIKKHLLLFLSITGSLFAHAQQQLPNASFENWSTSQVFPYEEPDTWFGTSLVCTGITSLVCTGITTLVCDTSIVKTTDVYSGMYAAKLVNIVSQEDGSIIEGELLYSTENVGYENFTNKPLSLTGYYKFNQTASDEVEIGVVITGASNSSVAGYGSVLLTASKTDYTLFTVPITLTSVAAKNIQVYISFNEDASVDSDFTVDNLVFTYASTPTSTKTPVAAGIKFFPNPGKDVIYFEKKVKNISIQSAGESDELNIGVLDQGIYIIPMSTMIC